MRKKMANLAAAALVAMLSAGAWAAAVNVSVSGGIATIDNTNNGEADHYEATPSSTTLTLPASGDLANCTGTKIKVSQIQFARAAANDASLEPDKIAIITSDGTYTSASKSVASSTGALATGTWAITYTFSTEPTLTVGTAASIKFYDSEGTECSKIKLGAVNTSGESIFSTDIRYNTTSGNTYVYIFRVTGTVISEAALTSGTATWDELDWNVTPGASSICYVDVADGATLTVSRSTAPASATYTGEGTVSFPDKTLPTANVDIFSDSDWTGTVVLNNCGADVSGTSGHGYVNFENYGNANSFIRAPGFKGYTKTDLNCAATLVIGSGETFTLTDGNASTKPYFAKLSGSGTLQLQKGRTAHTQYVFGDVSDFSGSVTLASDISHSVVFGGSSSWMFDSSYAKQLVVAGNATIASGATWTTLDGTYVSGTLTLADSSCVLPVISGGAGTIIMNGKVPSNDYLTQSTWTGTVQVNSDSTGFSSDSSKFMNSGSKFYLASGTVTLTGVSDLSGTVEIASGARLNISNTEATTLTIGGVDNSGTLDLTGCTALETLNFNIGTSRTLNLGAYGTYFLVGGTVNAGTFTIQEVPADGGSIAINSNVLSTFNPSNTYTITYADGTTLTPSSISTSGNVTTIAYTPHIDGAATMYDLTFTNTVAFAYRGDTVATSRSFLPIYPSDDSIQLFSAPCIENAGKTIASMQNAMSVAVVGQMSSSNETTFVHIGQTYQGQHGLLIATADEADKVVVAYNIASNVYELTTMTVPNARTTRHSYVVTKQDSESATTFTIYLDGIKWKTVPLDFVLEFNTTSAHPAGVQVGADVGGQIWNGFGNKTYKNIKATSGSSTADWACTDPGYINVLRVYDHVLTQAEVDVYAATYPYVSPSGSAVRTFTAAAEDWIEDEATDWENTTAAGVTTESGTPASGAAVTINTDVATTIDVNLAANASYESLTVNGTGATFQLAEGGSGTIAFGSSVIGAPVTIKGDVVSLSGGPTTITEDGSLDFDYSDYAVTGTTAIELTGDMEQDDTKVSITVPTNAWYTYTSGYSGSQYVITPSVAVATLEHDGTFTGYTTIAAAVSAAEDGDTIYLNTTELTPSTLLYTAEGTDKSGVTFVVHGVEIAASYDETDTTWTTDAYYHWTGEASDSNWTTPANWGLTTGYPNTATISASFDDDATVVVDNGGAAKISISNIVIAASKTLTLSTTVTTFSVRGNIWDGSASNTNTCTLVLNGATITEETNDINIYAKLVAEENSSNEIKTGSNKTINIRGALEGNGNITFNAASGGTSSGSGRDSYIYLYGSTADFAGEAWVCLNGQFNSIRFMDDATQDNSKANWHFYETGALPRADGNGAYNMFQSLGYGKTYKFGSLNGRLRAYGYSGDRGPFSITFEVGYENEPCGVSGTLDAVKSSYLLNWTIDWVASEGIVFTNNLTYGSSDSSLFGLGKVVVSGGGTMEFGSTASVPLNTICFTNNAGFVRFADGVTGSDISSKFASSDAAIGFDDMGVDYTWASPIAASNTGGFTKKGSGTLTLTTAPAYSGKTTVSEGVLVLPCGYAFTDDVEIDDGAYIKVQGDATWEDASEHTILTFAEGKVPDAATMARIAIVGLSARQSYELELNAETREYVATISGGAVTWAGDSGDSWSDANKWLVGEEETSFMSGDKVIFADSSFDETTTEMTVNITADVDPVTISASPSSGNKFILAGDYAIKNSAATLTKTGAGTLVLNNTGNILDAVSIEAGTLELADNAIEGIAVANVGTLKVASESAEVSLGAITGSGTISVDSGTAISADSISTTTSLAIGENGVLRLEGTSGYGTRGSNSLLTSGAGELVIANGVSLQSGSDGNTMKSFSGTLTIESGGIFRMSKNTGSNQFGTGILKLAGGTIYSDANGNGADRTINNSSIELVEETSSTVQQVNSNLYFANALTGEGSVTVAGKSFKFAGNASTFGGTITFGSATVPTRHGLASVASGSENGTYQFTGVNTASEGYAATINVSGSSASSPLKLGVLTVASGTTINNATSSTYVEVGNKGASTLEGGFCGETLVLTKVGSSTLTLGSAFSMVSGSAINVNAGKLVTDTSLALDGVDVTLADGVKMGVALADTSSTGNQTLFTTTGTVTLTGTQTVDTDYAGTSIGYWTLDTSEDDGTTTVFAKFHSAGEMDGTTAVVTDTIGTVNIPSTATAVNMVVTGESATLVSATALSTDNVTVYATDASGTKTSTNITGAFKVTAGEGNTYTIELDDTATVGEVSVKPAIDTTAEEPMNVGEGGTPTFTVKAIDGLWYAVEAADSPDGFASATPGTPVQADDGTASLAAPEFTGTVKYYKIAVAPSKAALE